MIPALSAAEKKKFSDEEIGILSMRFGWKTGKPLTLQECADILSRPRDKIRVTEIAAMEKLETLRAPPRTS